MLLAETLVIGYNGECNSSSRLEVKHFEGAIFMEELTITEVAKRAGLRTSAIRYYESIGLLPSPQRVSGRRRYSPDILRKLSFIQVAQAAGLSIAEIQTLLNELDGGKPLSERWQALALHKLAEVDALMRKVQGMKMILENGLNCDCASLEECMDCIIRAPGVSY